MKTCRVSKFFFVSFLLCFCGGASLWANQQTSFQYNKLQSQSYDEMLAEVKTRVKRAEATDDAKEAQTHLKEALVLIFSRPDSDNMVAQLVPFARSPLKNMNAYDEVIVEIAENTVQQIKSNSGPAVEKATRLILIANLMGEIKPDLTTNKLFKKLFIQIRDAQLTVPDDAAKHLRMNAMMKKPISPSDIAAKALGSSQ